MYKEAEIVLNMDSSKGIINPYIYGHFTEHIGGVFYDGLWVGEDSSVENIHGFRKALVDSFRKINPPVLRWPGGCFSETYNWRDGIGSRDSRPQRSSWWYSYDHRIETNQVGTHEFIDFCRLVGAEPYFAANMTSTTPLDIRNWVEYCNMPENSTTLAMERGSNGSHAPFNVRFWGIGNENWGGGGQMTPEVNVQTYRRYATVINSLDRGNLNLIMCGANGHDIQWTRRVMQEWSSITCHEAPTWGMSIHYYCGTAGKPQDFSEDQWYKLLFRANSMRKMIDDHRSAMDEFDPQRQMRLAVDEWGCWHEDGTGPSKGYNLFEQQSNMRDAVISALTLNIFNNRCDVVAMANVAQLCNNLHSLYLASANRFVETPNYYVFDMYKTHQGGRHINALVHCDVLNRDGFQPMDSLSVSASEKDGIVTITLANLSMSEACTVKFRSLGASCFGNAHVTVLVSNDVHTCNTFEAPYAVVPYSYDCLLSENGSLDVPAASVMSIIIKAEASNESPM